MGRRVSFRAGLLWVMWGEVLGVACAAGLHLRGVQLSPVVTAVLGISSIWVPTAVCWLAVSRVGLRRPEVLLAAAAVTSWSVGSTYYVGLQTMAGPVPFPSFADVGSSLFYVLILAALVVAVHRQARGVASSVWWDAAVGSLGAAAVLAVVLRPVLDPALAGPPSLATVVLAAYPLFDLLLVAVVAGIAALRDVRMGSRWVLLVAGLMVFAAADVIYSLKMTSGTYVFGTASDALWSIGIALMALWVDGTAQQDRSAIQDPRPATGAMALTVSSVATLAGLGVLLTNTRMPVSTLAVALAGVTLLAAAARSQLAFRLLARMADLRRLAATTDELTGLPNRRALYAEGQVRLAEPQRRRQALLMLDLDKFKEVNDSLGHHAGDQLLVQVGARLREHLRGADMLARLGGDEFAALLGDCGHEEATDVALKLRGALAAPFAIEGIVLHSSVSVGIALFPGDGPDLSTLLRKADIAMYKAKASGSGVHCYGKGDYTDGAARLQMLEELRTAIATDRLVLHYQPKIDLDTGDVHAVEALVRWDHASRGLLYPGVFLAEMEEAGLMPRLTRVVLAAALDQVATWQAHGQQLTVAVNLSASSLGDVELPEEIAAMLADRGVAPHALQLEVTEQFLMADRERARDILTRLRRSGVQISVDDFGTGYSSLSYLRDLPIDELKLDRSFVFPMADDARAAALVASIIGLAHSLGLRIVAEGVETHVAYNELRRLGCDQAQGYFMSRPVPAAELDHWLSNRPAIDQPTDIPKPLPTAARG
jgi:diguanylate cyclase (GGDEF)-like protein